MVLNRYTKKYKVMRKKLKLKLGFRPSREMTPIPEEPEDDNGDGDGDVDVNVMAPPPSPESTSPSVSSSVCLAGGEDSGFENFEDEHDEYDEEFEEEESVEDEVDEEEVEERKEMQMQMVLYTPPLSQQSLHSRLSSRADSPGNTQAPSSRNTPHRTKPTKNANAVSKQRQGDKPHQQQSPTSNTTTNDTLQANPNLNSKDTDTDTDTDTTKTNPQDKYTLPYRASFITPPLGYGLIATQPIPAGTLIFADPVIYTSAAEQKACPTNTTANELLASKVRAMGPDWYRGFLTLTNPRRESLGVFAGIWDAHQVPIAGKSRGGMLGLNLAWVNHSCVPNCSVTVVQVRCPALSSSSASLGGEFGGDSGAGETTTATGASTNVSTNASTSISPEEEEAWIMQDGTGQNLPWDTAPRVIVRASTDISPGSEITIAYFFASGGHTQRELFTLSSFGFFCSCAACSIPTDKVERALRRLGAFNAMVEADDGVMVVQRPAAALQMAQEVVRRLLQVRVSDSRVAMVWVRCALLAAFHSDVARAVTFLLKARKMLFVLEGPAGRLYGQVGRWCRDVRLVPGFGGSIRGVSSLLEGAWMSVEMGGNEILYMLGARGDEYLRVGDYARFEGAVLVFRDGRGYEVVGGSSLLEIEVLPWCMLRSSDKKLLRLKKGDVDAAAAASSSSGAAGAKTDTPCKQEKDLLDVMRGLRRQQAKTKKPSSLSPRKWMDGQREKDRAAAKAMLSAAPLVKSVGARKNVTVETNCVVCHGPMGGLQPHIC